MLLVIELAALARRTTNGCISLRRSALVHVLRWLDPDARPQIAIGTAASLRQSSGG
jgi:hypothetical protein